MREGEIEKVELLGSKGRLNSSRDAAGHRVYMPDEKPSDVAYFEDHGKLPPGQGGSQPGYQG